MSDLSEEELGNIAKSMKEMGLKPRAGSSEEFQKWLIEFTMQTKSKKGQGAGVGEPQQPQPQAAHYQYPRLPTFSGDKKGEATFDLWKYKVQCLLKDNYSEPVIFQSIRRSLKGEASRIVMLLGHDATITDILDKFESVYGSVHGKATVLSEFYSAKQGDDDVANWGCRLEDLLNQAIREGLVQASAANNMLCSMFYEGLRPALKDATGFIFDKVQTFDELRREIRKKEEEISKRQPDKKANDQSVQSVMSQNKELDDLKSMVQKLTTDVSDMKINFNGVGHYQNHGYHWQQRQPRFNRGTRGFRGGRGQGRYHDPQQYKPPQRDDYQQDGATGSDSKGPICYRCGQEGHLMIGCRVRVDHLRRSPLNGRRPWSRRGR